MKREQIRDILKKHSAWLQGDGERADLSWADLIGADLSWADLSEADLSDANLSEAKWNTDTKWPAPPMLLLANWGQVSGDLCVELMRYDAANHPDPSRFDRWAKEDKCPYNDCRWGRCANFGEHQHLWSPGPALSALELCRRLLAEKCEEEK